MLIIATLILCGVVEIEVGVMSYVLYTYLGSYFPDVVNDVSRLVLLASQVPFVVHTASKRLRMVMAGGLALLYVTGMIFALSGSAFPFAGGENPSPKRLYLQVSV